MRKLASFVIPFFVASAFAWSEPGTDAFNTGLKKAEVYDWAGNYSAEEEELQGLFPAATNDTLRAELDWRLARVYLNKGDDAQAAGLPADAVVQIYQKGEAFADKAIAENPAAAQGYFWKSGNLGKVGLLRGVLNSLFMIPTIKDLLSKTIERDPNEHDAYFALAQLYSQAPGWPISLGDLDAAVSLARKAIDLMESDIAAGKYPNPNYEFYTELANDLYRRNWNVAKRNREYAKKKTKYESISDPMQKNLYYEGAVSIPQLTDRQESSEVLQQTVSWIEVLPHPTSSDLRVLSDAKKSLAERR